MNTQVTLYVDGSGNSQMVSSPNAPLPRYDSLGNVVAVDFFGDGSPDLIIADTTGGPLIAIGQGDGTFTLNQLTFLPTGPIVVAGDVNGDGFIDLGMFDNNGLFTYGAPERVQLSLSHPAHAGHRLGLPSPTRS